MDLDLKAELEEIARKRTEAHAARQAEKKKERADHLLRRKYGKATLHALKQARNQEAANG
jgi:hypothetical protein